MPNTKVFKSDTPEGVRISKKFHLSTDEVTRQRNPDGAILIREKAASSADYPNVVAEVLSRIRQCNEPCPDISDYFAGDKELPKEFVSFVISLTQMRSARLLVLKDRKDLFFSYFVYSRAHSISVQSHKNT